MKSDDPHPFIAPPLRLASAAVWALVFAGMALALAFALIKSHDLLIVWFGV